MLRRVLIALAVLAVLALVVLALRPSPIDVETSLSDRGPLEEVVEGIGKVRVRERYDVASPVSGELARVTLHAGDPIRDGQVVARVTALGASPLDARSRAQAEARLSAALGAEAEARAAVARVGV